LKKNNTRKTAIHQTRISCYNATRIFEVISNDITWNLDVFNVIVLVSPFVKTRFLDWTIIVS